MHLRTGQSSGAQARGFALLLVVLLIALVASTVALALRDANNTLAESGTAKSVEIVSSELNRGLGVAIEAVTETDPIALINPANNWDIFVSKTPPNPPFLPSSDARLAAPAGATYAVPITVGLKAGQRTSPLPGEDVRTTYGYIVEVQLQADMDATDMRNLGVGAAEERVSVGVRVPQVLSHANN